MRDKLKAELETLVKAEKWDFVKAWFTYWDSEEELAHKVSLWGYLFMPEYFRAQSCDAQIEVIRRFFSDRDEYTALPRGFAKTTITQLCLAFTCAYHMDEFIPVIEKTHTEASEVLQGVRDVFDEQMTKKVYGNLIGKDKHGKLAEKMSDSQGDIYINGVRLRAVGFNKTIRGLKSKAWRPTRIIVDDVEEDTHIGNPDQREKYMQNYLRGILPALDIDGTVKVTGTILHFDSLLYNLINQHDGKIYKAFDKEDPEHTLLWPQQWTYEKLMKKKEAMMDSGNSASAFFQEYLNEPIGEEDRYFQWDWITQTYKEEDLKYKELNLYATLDVADTVSATSDYTGITVVAVDKEGNWYIRWVKRKRLDVKDLINTIFELWNMEGMRTIGIEKKSFEDQIQPFLEEEKLARGEWPNVVELKHGGKRKIDRIKGELQPLYRSGKIFNREDATDDTKLLWDELYSVGAGTIASKHDDLVDALTYIGQIAERPTGRAFMDRYDRKPEVRREDTFAGIRAGNKGTRNFSLFNRKK